MSSTFEGLGIQKKYPQALRQPPYPNLPPQHLSWYPQLRGVCRELTPPGHGVKAKESLPAPSSSGAARPWAAGTVELKGTHLPAHRMVKGATNLFLDGLVQV